MTTLRQAGANVKIDGSMYTAAIFSNIASVSVERSSYKNYFYNIFL